MPKRSKKPSFSFKKTNNKPVFQNTKPRRMGEQNPEQAARNARFALMRKTKNARNPNPFTRVKATPNVGSNVRKNIKHPLRRTKKQPSKLRKGKGKGNRNL